MPSIGSFNSAVREIDPAAEPVTFEFFGEQFTVQDGIPPILMLQFGAAAAGQARGMESMATVFEILRTSLTRPVADSKRGDTAEFDRFYQLALARKCDEDDLVALAWSLVGAQSDLPTVQLPTSPDGQLPTSENSNSSSPDTPDSPALESVEDRLAGLA